jgi:hypothetical protein
MKRRRSFSQLLARLSLLIAITSHLGIAAVGPFAHFSLLNAEQATTEKAPDAPRQSAPVPVHDESHCLLCHSIGTVAVLATAPSTPVVDVRFAPPLPGPVGPPADGARPLPQARAPPLFA